MGGKAIALGLALALAVPGLALAQSDEAKWAQASADYAKLGNSKDPSERTRAAEGVGEAAVDKRAKQAVQMILALLTAELGRDKGGTGKDEEKISGEVLDACESALKSILGKVDKSREAVDLLTHQAKSRTAHPRLRFFICRALGVHKDALKTLAELVDDKDVKVQIGAVDGLAASKDAAAIDPLLKVLGDAAKPWECKISALGGLERIGDKSDKVVDGMIDALEKCKPDEGRVKFELMRILGVFLGIKDPKSDDPNWWRAARKDKDAPAKDGQTTSEPTEFFGLKTKSTRIVFVLDRTGSMQDPCTWPDQPKKEPPKPNPEVGTDGKKTDPGEEASRAKAAELKKKYDNRDVKTKMDGLKREFINTIYNLDPRVHFTVVWFEANQQFWKEQLVPATWANKLDCIQDIDRLNPSGGTGIWGGLEQAYKLVEQPAKPDVVQVDKKGNYATVVNGPDTFFLMTDGNHNTGKFTKDDGGRPSYDEPAFIGELKKVHALRKVLINVVALGDLNKGSGDMLTDKSLKFLKKIAEETGGSFAHIGKP